MRCPSCGAADDGLAAGAHCSWCGAVAPVAGPAPASTAGGGRGGSSPGVTTTRTWTINGRTYGSLEDMTPEDREVAERLLGSAAMQGFGDPAKSPAHARLFSGPPPRPAPSRGPTVRGGCATSAGALLVVLLALASAVMSRA